MELINKPNEQAMKNQATKLPDKIKIYKTKTGQCAECYKYFTCQPENPTDPCECPHCKRQKGKPKLSPPVELICLECGHIFKRKLSDKAIAEVRCPKCESADIDLA